MVTRVAHLTTAHARGEVRIFLKECVSLVNAAFDVHVVVADGLGPETMLGITIHDAGAARGRFDRMLVLPWRMLRVAWSLEACVYHFHEPEILLIALALKRGGARVVYDSHEDVPRAILSREWIGSRSRRLVSKVFERFENFVSRRISAVVGATDHIAKRFQAVNARSVAIKNYPLASEISGEPVSKEQGPCICYIGGISRTRGIFQMVEALELVDARLILAGSFETAEIEQTVRRMPGWSKVDYRGVVKRAEVQEIMAASRAGLLFLHAEPNHVDSQPNKMYEYMAAGLPVLASDFPFWRDILERLGAGRQANPLDVEAIAALIRQVLDDPVSARAMGERGRRAVLSQYQWKHEEQKLLSLYRDLLA